MQPLSAAPPWPAASPALSAIFLSPRFLGAGPLAEIFVIAFRLPNLFRRLFAEGAFNAAFVPLFTEKLNQDGKQAALAFAAQICAVLLAAACRLYPIWRKFSCPLWCWLWRKALPGEAAKFELAVHYARIAFPYLIAMSLMSLFAAMLNATGAIFCRRFRPDFIESGAYRRDGCGLGRHKARRSII